MNDTTPEARELLDALAAVREAVGIPTPSPSAAKLGEGGHDQADPPVGLSGGADLGGGQPEGARAADTVPRASRGWDNAKK
jgi:hypothetical protein